MRGPIAEALRAAREEAGLTVAHLAARLQTSEERVRLAESGDGSPPWRYVRAHLEACRRAEFEAFSLL